MVALDATVLGGIAVLVLLSVSAFFSSAEIAVFSLPVEWIDETVDAGDPRAGLLGELRGNPHRLLVTLLVGNNLVNVAISSITTVVLLRHFPEGIAVTAATLGAASLVLIFGEILPKSYGLGHARTWALSVARPIRLVERLLYPLVAVFDALTRRLGAVVGGDQDIEEPYTD
jgi:Mg2+/Co2+ transporter CorB